MQKSLATLSIIVGLISLLGCSGGTVRSAAPRREQSAIVVTAVAYQKTLPVDIRVIGNVEAYTVVRVRAQATGQLLKVNFEEGQNVRKADLLFVIDPRPYDEAIRQAEANLARNTALLGQAEANLKRDVAQERYARDQADRYQKLFTEGVMSRMQMEQFSSDAAARGEGIRADQAAIESAQASMRADKAALANATLQRSYCEVHSPVDGRTGDIAVEEGNLVQANSVDLVTINQVLPIYVTFSVPERYLSDIKKFMAAGGLAVEVSPPSAPDRVERGTLTFVDNAVDTTTGTIKLKGTFTNKAGRLWPGQFVNVLLQLTTVQNAVVVPVRAVQTGQTGEFAYVVGKDMTAEMRPVVTGLRVGEEVVVQKGLELGETVVTEGQLRIAPGMKVRTKQGRTL